MVTIGEFPILTLQEPIPGWRVDHDEVDCAVVGDALRRRNPVGRAQVRVLLQTESSGGIRPRDERGVGGRECDRQQRRAGRLHRGEQAPESVGECVVAAANRARVRLTDGAAHGINAARARGAAAVNREPVNGVILRVGALIFCPEILGTVPLRGGRRFESGSEQGFSTIRRSRKEKSLILPWPEFGLFGVPGRKWESVEQRPQRRCDLSTLPDDK